MRRKSGGQSILAWAVRLGASCSALALALALVPSFAAPSAPACKCCPSGEQVSSCCADGCACIGPAPEQAPHEPLAFAPVAGLPEPALTLPRIAPVAADRSPAPKQAEPPLARAHAPPPPSRAPPAVS